MKLAIVVQRYGADINGGAELHARYVAEHLATYAEVRVLTTCARDYLTWRNELPAGIDSVNGITVERFPVEHERDEADFGLRSWRHHRNRFRPRRMAGRSGSCMSWPSSWIGAGMS